MPLARRPPDGLGRRPCQLAVGAGAVAGGLVSTFLVRGRRLAPLLAAAMVVVAVLSFAAGLTLSVVAAFVILPLIGLSRAVIDLLADVPRTATVTSLDDGLVLAIDRAPFLIAVTGHDTTRQAAWGVVRSLGGGGGPTVDPPG